MHDIINQQLLERLDQFFMTPEAGMQEIRKVLLRMGYDMPAFYDMDPEGDEFTVQVSELNENEESETLELYVIYYLTDDDVYEFYAEVVDEENLNQIMSDEEEDEEE